jgi:hypothetical protein
MMLHMTMNVRVQACIHTLDICLAICSLALSDAILANLLFTWALLVDTAVVG